MAYPDWIGVLLPEDPSGDKQLSVMCSPNTSMSPRSGVITVKTSHGDNTAEVTVSQKAHTISYDCDITTVSNCSLTHTNAFYLTWKWDNGETHQVPGHLGSQIAPSESQEVTTSSPGVEASVGNIVGVTVTRTPDSTTVAVDLNLTVNGYTVMAQNKKAGDYMTLNTPIPVSESLSIRGTVTYKDL